MRFRITYPSGRTAETHVDGPIADLFREMDLTQAAITDAFGVEWVYEPINDSDEETA